jgi:hypothetical protein
VIIGLGIAALVFGTAWLIFARYAGDPVIPLRLFRDRTFRIACGRSQRAACLPLACAAATITRPSGELRRSTIRVSR